MRLKLATSAGLLSLLLAVSRSADLPAASPTTRLVANETATAEGTGDRADAIASQTALLGDPSYAVRERATKNLIDAGIAGRPLLERLRSSADPEIRARAAKVLRIVMETDFRVRLRAFAADIDGHRGISLPGWERFRREAGESREARQLFVIMQRGEATLLEALASGDPTISELFGQRCQEFQSSLSTQDPFAAAQADSDDPSAKAGAIAALLFVGAAPEVKLEEQQALWVENFLGYAPFKEALGARGPLAPLYQQLVSRWLVKAGMLLPYYCLLHSFEWDLKSASLTLSRKLLASGGAALNDRVGVPDARPYALLAFGRFGGREDLPLVESFFDVDKVCFKHRHPTAKSSARAPLMDVEVRDVALAVAAHLTGQDLRGVYGYRFTSNPLYLFVVSTLGFPDEAARQRAFRTWADWKAHQSQEPAPAGK